MGRLERFIPDSCLVSGWVGPCFLVRRVGSVFFGWVMFWFWVGFFVLN